MTSATPGPVSEAAEQLAALERFIAENDDLLDLEERIGRFNIFDALGIARVEIRHSNFLAWLLDPNESHGQGALFLKAVLMDLFKTARECDIQPPLSPVEIDGAELQGVEVRREWRNIDLLIVCRAPAFVVVVENKVDTGEHDDQLQRYEITAAQEFHEHRLLVYLTPDGGQPSRQNWVPYGYDQLHRVLSRCVKAEGAVIGPDVRAFLDHYLRMVGSRFMEDKEIDQLCRTIYKNHRQAIDLIIERGRGSTWVREELDRQMNELGPDWIYLERDGAYGSGAMPKAWCEWVPPVGQFTGRLEDMDRHGWLSLWACFWDQDTIHLDLYVGPTADSELQQQTVEAARAHAGKMGFTTVAPKQEGWVRIVEKKLWSFAEKPELDPADLAKELRAAADTMVHRLGGLEQILRPIFDDWRAKQTSKGA